MQEFIITFRETFEVALIAGIVLSFLNRTNQSRYDIVVYAGIAAAVLVSVLLAFILSSIGDGFTGRTEELYEGSMMYLSVIFLSFMILSCIKHKHKVADIEKKITTDLDNGYRLGLFFLIFIAVLREGVETVLFLRSIIVAYEIQVLWFSLLGVFVAVVLGYAMFKGMVRFDIKKFFNVTSTLLILFAAGLLAHGTHELQEAGVLPVIFEHVWDINPESITHPLHEKGIVGSFMKSLFGYNGNPSLIEVMSYLTFLALTFGWWKNYENQQRMKLIKAE